MKKILTHYIPAFDPVNKTLDFSELDDFSLHKVYAIINTTRNTPIYIPGVDGYGASIAAENLPHVMTLQFDTSSHAANDIINVYYEVDENTPEHNSPIEAGGNLESINMALIKVLIELRIMNNIILQGMIGYPLRSDDVSNLRNDMLNTNDINNIISE